MKFERAIAEFWTKMMRKWYSTKTTKIYIELTKRIYEWCGKTENRKEITAKEIETWIYSKKVSSGTKNVYAVQIRSFLRFCRSLDIAVVNPEQIAVQKYHLKEAKYLNEEQENIMLEKLKEKSNTTLKVAVLLMLTTGLRISEACWLTKKALKNAEKVGEMRQLPITWKWEQTRAVFVPPKVYELLNWSSERHNKKTVLPVKIDEIEKLIKNFSKEIEINFRAHTLRHTFLTKLARKGVDLYKIQKIAGHKCIITTSRYLHTHNIELANATGLIANISY